jgi:hypothetical protein
LIIPHLLPQATFTELAEGAGGPDAVRLLQEAQLSKHLMLLHAIASAAGGSGHGPSAFRAGYELLARLQAGDPGADAWLLGLPHLGGWANDCLIHLEQGSGITARHLEPHSDRGDGVLVLIRPHDDVPKTLVLGRLIPILTAFLIEHNASATRPELRLRLRAVMHAGEIHLDDRGFYGDDLDVAFRLLEAPRLKKALKEAVGSPLVLVVSEQIFHTIIRQGYFEEDSYQPLGRVRVGNRHRRGWVHFPAPFYPDRPGAIRRPKGQLPPASLAIAPSASA